MPFSLEEVVLPLADRQHIRQSRDRISRSADIQNQIQATVRASIALIECAQARWPLNLPTLPKPTGTSHERKSTSASNSNLSSD
jgi:hypothetical protein